MLETIGNETIEYETNAVSERSIPEVCREDAGSDDRILANAKPET